MASLGHIAVGMFAGRRWSPESNWRHMVLFSELSLLPDLDVIAFAFGVPYSAPLGHRGFSHSIAFAIVLGALAGVWMKRWRAFVFVALVVASHGLLDALTDGGEGVALLWPFTGARYFFPWQPIPVAPIGLGFVSVRGLECVVTEAVLFAPLLIAALWRRR